ncbi:MULTISPECIES: SpoVR family protein [Geobacter]|uniref:SpoVR family protein n=1 Tax=Geobacter TaxID=28231 RepID=UPI00257455AC|nr:SpoVR family protein [Geobacter sulfurreducens]BEH11877.1 SpoVR family protein [Geobacter sulfurreducens subsp. ethanolicus]BET59741.1 SpoVR family protein [Geobacter sp. 60473]
MQLIDQHTKKIMEGCKDRAREAGLRFSDETLEYIVTNRDMLELHPKVMIPTLYDYWVHDVEVLKEKGKYELYPHNPYETVINTRPPISFYNDNNPDWLNVMIFYHVLAHIDFFQNNLYYRHTWDYDLTGKALADKRLIARLRSEHGRRLDYVIEFGRSIDNLVGYYGELSALFRGETPPLPRRLDYYFDVFLQRVKKVKTAGYVQEIERYNRCMRDFGDLGEETFFAEVMARYPEFEALYLKSRSEERRGRPDLMQFIMEHSPVLNREEHRWMKSVLEVIRSTSVYFQPQMRTKIMNEGWASYWHEKLFLTDDRIRGHEVDFARVHSGVTCLHRVGLNPYAIGMRLFQHIEEQADKGRISLEFQQLADIHARQEFDRGTGGGTAFIFAIRENLCDFSFINTFVDQDFVNRHKLFVAGRRLNKERMTWQYYVKSRTAEAYRAMLAESLYHPPVIAVDEAKGEGKYLYLDHRFEGKPLVKDFIENTLMGIEYLWGGPVKLETSEVGLPPPDEAVKPPERQQKIHWRRYVYTMEDRKLSRTLL